MLHTIVQQLKKTIKRINPDNDSNPVVINSPSKKKKIAVYLDADDAHPQDIPHVFHSMDEEGKICLKRYFSTQSIDTTNDTWFDTVHRLSIRPTPLIGLTDYKNRGADIALAMDAMHAMISEDLDTFVLITSDSSFIPLVLTLKKYGKTVYIFGSKDADSQLKTECDQYFETHHPPLKQQDKLVTEETSSTPIHLGTVSEYSITQPEQSAEIPQEKPTLYHPEKHTDSQPKEETSIKPELVDDTPHEDSIEATSQTETGIPLTPALEEVITSEEYSITQPKQSAEIPQEKPTLYHPEKHTDSQPKEETSIKPESVDDTPHKDSIEATSQTETEIPLTPALEEVITSEEISAITEPKDDSIQNTEVPPEPEPETTSVKPGSQPSQLELF